MDHDCMNGLTDWEKRRLALTLKERGQTAFMVIKHAKAAVSSAKRVAQLIRLTSNTLICSTAPLKICMATIGHPAK